MVAEKINRLTPESLPRKFPDYSGHNHIMICPLYKTVSSGKIFAHFVDLAHAAERKAFELVLNSLEKKSKKNRHEGYVEVVNAMQKVLGDGWPDEAYDRLRATFSKGGKYANFFDRLLDTTDPEYLKGLMMSFGYEAALSGFRRTRKSARNSACRFRGSSCSTRPAPATCTAPDAGLPSTADTLNLSYEDMDSIVTQGNELGIHAFIMTGGEPMVRKKDIIRLAQAHPDCGFMIFTNGTLVDQPFIDEIKKSKNIIFSMSIEGLEEATDSRRGKGVFQKVMSHGSAS
jgi:hypothetical protein